MAGAVSRETFERLVAFEFMFRKWAQRINLTASSQLADLWERHILDSAQLLPLGGNAAKWIDLGSGGGFPGAVLAIMLADRPSAKMVLVESNRKKTAFLQTALAGYTNKRILPIRIEDAAREAGPADIVTARALAPLKQLLVLAEPWLSKSARGLFLKGAEFGVEIEESRDAWDFDLIEHPSKTNADGVVLEISHLRRKR